MPRANLSGTDLRGAHLSGADLRGALLGAVNLAGAKTIQPQVDQGLRHWGGVAAWPDPEAVPLSE